ncbi:MAG TPA: 3-deoxy-manno-octulosonate cytidylyltransferase [Blastocatellia bacterium]|nr:3-deoxy-manno-octulosonate cytidylyltransferase [Blastocatellia bacterium]
MKGTAVAIIPARYGSTRLPGKPLLPISNLPMIMHVVQRASCARLVSEVFVATDDRRIANEVRRYGGQAVLTSPDARTGTDRVAEVAANLDSELIVNIQGDEPMIEPSVIDAAIHPLVEDDRIQLSTTSEPITSVEDVFNPNVVKVVTDQEGFALYFSRSPIPNIRPGPGLTLEESLRRDPLLLSNYRKHSGLYAYRSGFLQSFSRMEQTPLERLEALEQLRALENGYRVRVVKVEHRSIGVDTEQDYVRVKRLIEENAI